MAADVGVVVGAHDHHHGIPADVVADADLDVGIAGVGGLPVSRDGIDVFGRRAVRDVYALFARLGDQVLDEEVRAFGDLVFDDAVQRLLPFARFLRVRVGARGDLGLVLLNCHLLVS